MAQDLLQERSLLSSEAARLLLMTAFVSASVLISTTPAPAAVTITEDTQYRYIHSDGLPDHATGKFPNPGNPNRVSAKAYRFRIAVKPVLARRITSLTNRILFGVGRNGIPFDPGTAEFYRNDPAGGWNYEALSGRIDLGLDEQNAHVQPDGAYHYHGLPAALMGYTSDGHSLLIGYAADGFPIYALKGYSVPDDPAAGITELHSSYRLREGRRSSGPGGEFDGTFVQDYEYVSGTGDLDECNGRFGQAPGYPEGTYYYVLTREYPYIPRCLKGAPDESFRKSGLSRGGGMSGAPDRRGPPAEAVAACRNSRDGEHCSFRAPHGTISGTCRPLGKETACVPAGHRQGPGGR
ncbi:MAG: YHYH protein [Candidatus Omnitrophica bacterium]|nr:YHYH protein [Candidatus Omnitrophota bacterium]MCB9722146.1 YHYH protein [Candidatus Omnitrophota bacterium]